MSIIDNPIMYGFFSRKNAIHNREVLVITPASHNIISVYRNPEGKEVYVTHVESSPHSSTNWDDTVSLGQVVERIRLATTAEITSILGPLDPSEPPMEDVD